jgi:hypothetical protein
MGDVRPYWAGQSKWEEDEQRRGHRESVFERRKKIGFEG